MIPHDPHDPHDTLPQFTIQEDTLEHDILHQEPSDFAPAMADLNEPCRLLSLPAELREQIWILVVDPGDPTYHQREPELMCVSRGVRAETFSIYYSRYTLLITGKLCHRHRYRQSPLRPYTSDVTHDHERIEPRKLARITRFKLRYRLSASNIPGYVHLEYEIILNKCDGGYTLCCSLGEELFRVMTESQTTYITNVETALRSLLSAKLAALMAGGRMARGSMDAATLTTLTRIRKGCLPLLDTLD